MQVGNASRMLSSLTGDPGHPLVVQPVPADGLVVPSGGTVHSTPDGLIVVDRDGSAVAYVHSSGMCVRPREARSAPQGSGRSDSSSGDGDSGDDGRTAEPQQFQGQVTGQVSGQVSPEDGQQD
jgi:hypothetical protein